MARPVATPTRGLAPDVAEPEPGSTQKSEQKGDDDDHDSKVLEVRIRFLLHAWSLTE